MSAVLKFSHFPKEIEIYRNLLLLQAPASLHTLRKSRSARIGLSRASLEHHNCIPSDVDCMRFSQAGLLFGGKVRQKEKNTSRVSGLGQSQSDSNLSTPASRSMGVRAYEYINGGAVGLSVCVAS